MNRIKLIRKMAIPGAIIFVVSIIVLLSQIPYHDRQNAKRATLLNEHVDKLTQEYQKYLTETAQKIKSLPIDQKLLSDVQSKFLREKSKIKLYMWMNTADKKFVFGVPSVSFARLNSAYDEYEDIIKSGGRFLNRNEFILQVIHNSDKIDFSTFGKSDTQISYRYRSGIYSTPLRLDGELNYRDRYNNPYVIALSTPIMNESGVIIGELYLKLDDSANLSLYRNRRFAEDNDIYSVLNPLFGILTGFSGLFLWFLLPTWVYVDAQQRDAKNPGLWAFLSVISLFFGMTIYLLTRPSTYKAFHCPKCENELNGTKAFCPHCAFDLSGTFCPQCQYPIKPNWQFCPNCRAGLEQEVKKEIVEGQKSEESTKDPESTS